jgi:nucleotide-binding universal stress UspA family protein
MRILVPVDGSPVAEEALPTAAALAQAEPDSTVTLLFVVPRAVAPAEHAVVVNDSFEREAAQGIAYLERIERLPLWGHVKVEHRIAAGDPSGAIGMHAEALQMDLTVMTSHGETGLAYAILGSVAETVGRHSHIPTLILHAGTSFAIPQARPFTILVPLDGSQLAEATLEPAKHLARMLHGHLRLVQVAAPPPGMVESPGTSLDEATAYLQTVQQRLAEQGVQASTVAVWGDVSDAILSVTTDPAQPIDMIALATTGAGIHRPGRVVQSVVHQTTLPMLVVRPLHALHAFILTPPVLVEAHSTTPPV